MISEIKKLAHVILSKQKFRLFGRNVFLWFPGDGEGPCTYEEVVNKTDVTVFRKLEAKAEGGENCRFSFLVSKEAKRWSWPGLVWEAVAKQLQKPGISFERGRMHIDIHLDKLERLPMAFDEAKKMINEVNSRSREVGSLVVSAVLENKDLQKQSPIVSTFVANDGFESRLVQESVQSAMEAIQL
ncbi:MAG: hypothetical protein IPK22_03200 [Verrucomicrobiaceae bacterium]|nr:hypothetical protein [Verrucomicrobiaceae bacterium]